MNGSRPRSGPPAGGPPSARTRRQAGARTEGAPRALSTDMAFSDDGAICPDCWGPLLFAPLDALIAGDVPEPVPGAFAFVVRRWRRLGSPAGYEAVYCPACVRFDVWREGWTL
jgi:hypothetical protein